MNRMNEKLFPVHASSSMTCMVHWVGADFVCFEDGRACAVVNNRI
jgi:hypothetical protein